MVQLYILQHLNLQSTFHIVTAPNWVNFESVFFIQGAKLVKSDSNTYQNCYVAKDGGVFSLIQSNFYDVGSTF